jgi:hypothetical protein
MNSLQIGLQDPATDWAPIDVSNEDHVANYRALRATGAGNIAVNTVGGGSAARTLAFASGETRRVLVTKVLKVGTTATGIEGAASKVEGNGWYHA